MRATKLLRLALLASLLAGCTLPTPTPITDTHCAPGELAAPALSSPAMWEVVDTLTPTLSWVPVDPSSPYPYGDCHPAGYHLRLSDIPNLWGSADGYTNGGQPTHWTPASALLPGREYQWGVAAQSGDSDGPFGGYRYFFTGPYCATDALVAPLLQVPANGALVDDLQPTLQWRYPNPCLPQGYRIDLSTSPTFADTSLSGGTGNPSVRWGPGSDLTNCTWYYWRVAPINDVTLGPFSITRNFFVNQGGSCAYPLPALGGDAPLPLVTVPPLLPSPTLVPFFTLKLNGNCRYGPGQVYGVLTSYLAGQGFPADGRSENGLWVRLKLNATARCWISITAGDLNTDVNGLPVLPDPPTPVPTAPKPKLTATPTKGRKP